MSSIEERIEQIVRQTVDAVMQKYINELSQIAHSTERKRSIPNYSVAQQPDPLSIIRPGELAEILSVSRVTIWRLETEGRLPVKIQIGPRCVGWLRKDIEEWLLSC